MNKDLKEFKIKEEIKYYPLLLDAINNSKHKAISDKEKERLNKELELIHYQCNSKFIYIINILCKEALKADEQFIINGNYAGLYVLYLLNCIKFDPLFTNCCFEAALGTKNNPKDSCRIEMKFTDRFKQKAVRILENINCNCVVCREQINSDRFGYMDDSYCLVPNIKDIDKMLRFEYRKDEYYPCFYNLDEYNDIVYEFFIETSEELNVLKSMRNRFGHVNSNEGLDDLRFLIDNNIRNHLFLPEDNFGHYNIYKKIKNIPDFIRYYSLIHSTFDSNILKGMEIFKCRDDVFYYFKKLKFSDDESFIAMENIRKGKKIKNDGLGIKAILDNIRYLMPNGHSAEHVYYALQMAQYIKKYPFVFLSENEVRNFN